MASSQPETKTLFNDPTCSDMKLLQISEGKTKEYHVHKAILINQSEYFRNAFTGRFKESTDSTMTLKEDDALHFEIVLKFIYTGFFDKAEIANIANPPNNLTNRHTNTIFIFLGLCKVADKYAISRLIPLVAKELSAALRLQNGTFQGYGYFKKIVETYYPNCATSGTPPGRKIAHHMVKYSFPGGSPSDFHDLLRKFPDFAIDIVLDQNKQGILGICERKCPRCSHKVIQKANNGYCSDCGDRIKLEAD